jgi:hypothetical protein
MYDTSFRNVEQRGDRRARRVQLGDARSGRVACRFVDDGVEGVCDALDERKAGVGPIIDEAEVPLFPAERRPFVAVTLERSNGAARVLDGVCLEQLE